MIWGPSGPRTQTTQSGIMSTSRPRLLKHVHAHEAVIANEYWYGDGAASPKPFILGCENGRPAG